MKKKHRKALGLYIRHIANEMGLKDWTFDLVIELPRIETSSQPEVIRAATNHPTDGCKNACLTFHPECNKWDKKYLREVVVHELLHLQFAPLWHQIRTDIIYALNDEAYKMFIQSAERNIEYAIDGASTAWSHSFPLIQWSEKKGKS